MLTLPAFTLFGKSAKVPHVASVVARREWPNEHGTPIVYTVRRARNGKTWWINATFPADASGFGGMKASATLGTGAPATAERWIAAVESGDVQVGD